MFQIIWIIEKDFNMFLQKDRSKKGMVIIKVHLGMRDPGMPQYYQNMFDSYMNKEKKS